MLKIWWLNIKEPKLKTIRKRIQNLKKPDGISWKMQQMITQDLYKLLTKPYKT